MMMVSRKTLSISALALAVALPQLAQAQEKPFLSHSLEMSQAYGLEATALRLDLAAAFEAPYDEELAESLEDLRGPDLSRFIGTLTEKDAELAGALTEALEEVAEAAEDGKSATDAVAEARALLAKAYDVVIPSDLRASAGFKGGVAVKLLLAEGGVAEGYEEAAEEKEPWEYPKGFVALERVKVLWGEISEGAEAELKDNGDEMIALLSTLYPSVEPPESVDGWNPEEAEAPAQRLGGIIESIVKADLYPGRDLAGLATHLGEMAAAACALSETNEGKAFELFAAAGDLYGAELAATASLFAEDAAEEANEAFEAILGYAPGEDDDDDDDEAEGDEDHDDADADDDEIDDDAACGVLTEALSDIRAAFGG